MKLTPMEINNKEFKKGIRGYVQDEVDEFLDRVVEEYEALYKENSKLKEKLENANEKLNHHSQMESTIQSTLILAQETAEQSRKTAQDEADRIIRKANDTAQKILDKAHSDVLQINDDYDLVKQEFIKFRAKFRNFMNFQMETFDDLERDFVKNFNVTKPESEEAIEEKGIEISDFDYTREVNISGLNNVEDEDVMMDDDMKEIKSYFAEN
ncbi:MAG: DivIVA domain-containing protein [Sarcina sp.]